MLGEGQDIIIYFASGRAAVGSSPGMLYLLPDAFIRRILPNSKKAKDSRRNAFFQTFWPKIMLLMSVLTFLFPLFAYASEFSDNI